MSDASSPADKVHDEPEAGSKAGRRKVWTWAIFIAFGGFLFGFDTGVISGALLFIKTEFDLSSFEQSSVVSVLLIGAMIGALTAGRLGDTLGRKKLLGFEGAVFLIGTAIAVFATGYPMLLLARLILGLAVGAASATVPTYLGEISPAKIRGRILTLNQLMITIGIMVSYLTNLIFTSTENWRAMIGLGAVPALLIIIGALAVIPESPQWLVTNGKQKQAQKVFTTMTDSATAEKMIDRQETQEKEDEKVSSGSGWHLLFSQKARPALTVGVVLAALQQFAGINVIIYYAPTIMERTGLSASNAIYYSVAIGIINFLMTIVTIFIVDKVGRRKLLMTSLALMAGTLVFAGLSFFANLSSGLSLAAMVLFIGAFAVGMGPLFWTLIGEIFPPKTRSVGSSAATAVNWSSNFVVSIVFLNVVNAIGLGPTFWIFAAVSLFAVWFVFKYLPETRARNSREIDADLQQRFGRSPDAVSEDLH